MPDQAGAFLKADQCLSRLGLNIVRVSYNKAVDAHMLFIEVEGSEGALQLAQFELAKLGYLAAPRHVGNVILFEFKLKNEPGALFPIVELVDQFGFNISYMSYTQAEGDHQRFKMGLFVEKTKELSEFNFKICNVTFV